MVLLQNIPLTLNPATDLFPFLFWFQISEAQEQNPIKKMFSDFSTIQFFRLYLIKKSAFNKLVPTTITVESNLPPMFPSCIRQCFAS